jgi:CheY-like chemotaxis protein/HPt (histidine-containing phosphotransfer) domain-containing protein
MAASSADSARSAMSLLHRAAKREEPFHLVLTDAAMPDVDGFTLAERIASDYGSRAPKIILLTSQGSAALRGRRAKLFAAALAKPVKQSDLLDAIVTAFATPAASRRARRRGGSADPRLTRDAKTSLRVLVAEDNPTNQKVVSALLDQKGHTVTVVGNGRLAVERAAQEAFDLILMDVQMPEMGGLEATAAIRKAEAGTGRHLPIVALTARAMSGDREQCLAAGMDAYVSKPLNAPELLAAIDAVVAGASPTASAPPAADGARSVDLSALLAGFGGRSDIVSQVIDVFVTDAPAMLTRLRNAAAGADVAELAAAAHAIKGSAGLFSQGEAYERARALEMRARSGDGNDAVAASAEIEASVSRLSAELRGIRDTLSRSVRL